MSKKVIHFYLIASISRHSHTFLNFLYSWTIFSSSTWNKKKMLASSLTLRKKQILLREGSNFLSCYQLIQNNFCLKTGLLITLVTEKTMEFMASRAGKPSWVQSLPCVLEFLAELSWSLLPALWTFGLQPQIEHAGCGIQHNLSQSPAHKHVAALQCGWPHIACQEQS